MKKRVLRFLLIHGLAAVCFALLLWFGCPLYQLTGITCPCCGVTRAWLSFFAGDLMLAMRYNPFFLLIPGYLFIMIHTDSLLKKYRTAANWFSIIFTVILFAFNVLRWVGIVQMP